MSKQEVITKVTEYYATDMSNIKPDRLSGAV